MTKTRNNHYVPQWHQKGFMDERDNQLCHLTRLEIPQPDGSPKIIDAKKWQTPAQRFYGFDLYSTFFGVEVNDEIEQKLFGPIDENGSQAVRAYLTNDLSQWHDNFRDFFTYLDAQKLRTPKGLDWIRSKYPKQLSQDNLMIEMQLLRTLHCTLWAEGVRELVSAANSEVKFIVSDHPVTIYNYACSPNSVFCNYPNDPDISLKGSQTIFPLDKNRCLILTNLEYAKDPENVNPIEQRTNSIRMRRSMVNTVHFINTRELSSHEVTQINYIIKSRAKNSVAAGREEWLYPEKDITCNWAELRHFLIPPSNALHHFGGEMIVKFDNGDVHYQDAFGRTMRPNNYLNKKTNENQLGRNDLCGCGSGRKYKKCCHNIPVDLRTTWDVLSIRERNLAFCSCIKDVLGLRSDKTWLDVRKELSEEHIVKIYEFYSMLWPRETDIYSLLPKSDGKFRGLYSGQLDIRVIDENALPTASMFDEFLIQLPIANPNNMKPEFSPTKSPANYKYQALKDFLFMLEMEPFIGLGLVNLIPNPCEFDMSLLEAVMDVRRNGDQLREIPCEKDYLQHLCLSTEDLLNSTAMMPRAMRIEILVSEFGLDEASATTYIIELEKNAKASPLAMLQKLPLVKGGQLIQYYMAPNYEMTLLIAQVTGSVIVTDSGSRWKGFMSAQHREQGMATYPWGEISDIFSKILLDEKFLDTLEKSQAYFSKARTLLKLTDRLVLENNRNPTQLVSTAKEVLNFIGKIDSNSEVFRFKSLKISSPDGGFYDKKVQRLLARSSCLRYDDQVRSVYGIDL